MKKFLFSMVLACSALVMLSGCVVSEEKLNDKVTQGIVEYEQEHGNRLEVTDLKLEKSEGKNYKGVLTGKLNGEDVVYDVRDADIAEFDRWNNHARGLLKYITIGAEANGAEQLIRHAVSKGVAVAIGHTGATREQIDRAVDAGATLSTHLGNGIFAKLDRFENPIWPQLRNNGLTTGLIADGDHVTPDLVWVISRCKDSDHIILVSDLHHCAGLPPGRRQDGPLEIDIVKDGAVRVAGTPYLAGAGVHLLRCIWNYSRFTGTDLKTSFKLGTANPIRKYGLDSERAALRKGHKAEFITFTESGNGFELSSVFAGGISFLL